jgi:2-polyprenyl-3-methyl-5-hydroxy-6-metoxy-1,4-benzoquinol methylase
LRALGRTRAVRAATARVAQRLAEALHRLAQGVTGLPFRHERSWPPAPLRVGDGSADVIGDLVPFTGLPRSVALDAVRARRWATFGSEWWATPQALRHDSRHHPSPKGHLFANAVHFPPGTGADRLLVRHVDAGDRVLEFAGGTSNLTLHLAARGVLVAHYEVNALRRDLVRFRVARHGLADRVEILDPWDDVPEEAFDAVAAGDVLEHLPDARATLERTLLPALRRDGVLVENSPFERNVADPMHHLDLGFEAFMVEAGFGVLGREPDGTRAWGRAAAGDRGAG